MINVVLYEPEIPQNTGNIARLCACCGASLYLVGKLGFSLTDKYTKRAGMDYWDSVDLHRVDEIPEGNCYYLTTKAAKKYTDVTFAPGDFLVFGPESKGLPEQYTNHPNAITIPMVEGRRSLNLSNAVAIVAYEAVRQINLC